MTGRASEALPQRIRADLRDIALDLQALTDARAGWSRRGAPTGTTHHPATAGTPSRAPAAAGLLEVAVTDLWGIWRVALGEAHDPPPGATERPWLMAVRLAGAPWSDHDHTAGDLVAELAGWLARRAPAAVDVADVVTIGRCHCGTVLRAGTDALTRDTTLTCERLHRTPDGLLERTGCGATWRARELRARSLDAAGDRLGTATEIARALGGVTPGRVRLWASEGRLPRRGTTTEHARPAPLYRIGDVRDLAAQAEARRSRRAG